MDVQEREGGKEGGGKEGGWEVKIMGFVEKDQAKPKTKR